MDARTAVETATRATVAIAAPERLVLAVTGGDRLSWLNGLVTCDLSKLADGEVKYGLFVEKKGRVLADAFVFRDDGAPGDAGARVLVAVPRAGEGELRALLDKHLVMEDAELTVTEDAIEFVHGPRAGEVLAAMKDAGARGAPFDRTGLGGAVAFFANSAAEKMHSARDAALASVGGAPGDGAAWEAIRIERRVPELGVDFDASNYPQEAGLEKRAVSFDKGCYLGQEVVCMLEMRGQVKQRLVAIRVDAERAPKRGDEVKDAAGEVIGAVTSAAIVPSGTIAIAMAKRKKSDDGVELTVGGARGVVLGAL